MNRAERHVLVAPLTSDRGIEVGEPAQTGHGNDDVTGIADQVDHPDAISKEPRRGEQLDLDEVVRRLVTRGPNPPG